MRTIQGLINQLSLNVIFLVEAAEAHGRASAEEFIACDDSTSEETLIALHVAKENYANTFQQLCAATQENRHD